jgi:hypothetical protein
VEGLAPVEDEPKHAVHIAENVRSGNPKNFNTLLAQPKILCLVPSRLNPTIMCFAIDLDREHRRFAIEVEDIGAHRMLSAELEAVWPQP